MDDFNNGNEFDNDKPSEQSSLDANNYKPTNSDETSAEIRNDWGLDKIIPKEPLDVAKITASKRITANNNDDIPETLDDVFNMPSMPSEKTSSAIITPTDETKSEKKPANKLIRNKSIKTRVNEAEKEKISADAKAMHLNISDYIRSVALRKRMATPKFSSEDTENLDKNLREIKIELNRLGNNINQIAKYANTYKELDEAQYMQFFGMVGSFKRLEDTLTEIKRELK